MKRLFIIVFALCGDWAVAPTSFAASVRPNVVVLLADDAGWQGPLTLRALEIPGKSVMDVRRVTLTLLP